VVNTQNGAQLYKLAADGAAQLQPVQTGVSVDGMTEIRSGIAATDLIVFDGQSRLNPGTHAAATLVPARATAPGDAAVNDTVGDPS
jgi:multidrug efflux system membrane fusion protein